MLHHRSLDPDDRRTISVGVIVLTFVYLSFVDMAIYTVSPVYVQTWNFIYELFTSGL